jgi:hypothetical protein
VLEEDAHRIAEDLRPTRDGADHRPLSLGRRLRLRCLPLLLRRLQARLVSLYTRKTIVQNRKLPTNDAAQGTEATIKLGF